jgi:GlpG protein
MRCVFRSACYVIFEEDYASKRCALTGHGCWADATVTLGDRSLRQIGTLPSNLDSRLFGDHLLALGMKARFDEGPEGWLVWIYNEDHLARARSELEAFVRQPDDPRFGEGARAAEEVRRNEARLEKQYRKNYREVTDLWSGMRFRRRPLTLTLVFVAVAVFLLERMPLLVTMNNEQSSLGFLIKNAFWFTAAHFDPQRGWIDDGLNRILSGEIWRLITPIFLHSNILHIVFNCWAISLEGTMIETARGTTRLAILVLVSAVASNLGQYLYMDKAAPEALHLFGGLSGVGYALFGYLWMKGQYEPEQGMILHPNAITAMLMWLVFCMTGWVGPIANAAHVVGLIVGVAFGVMRF